MKVVLVSNFAVETVAEQLFAENLSEAEAQSKAIEWNNKYNFGGNSTYFATVKPDDYVLWRGMADLVGDP